VIAEPVPMRRLGIGVAVAVALVTSGCGAGQVAATANQRAVEAGTQADAGTIAIRGLLIQPPNGRSPSYNVGAAVPVTAVIVNSGTKADQLTGITSSAFSSWGAFKTIGEGDAVAAAAGQAPGLNPNPGGPSLPTPSTNVAIAPGSRVSWGVPDATGELLLMKLKQRLFPGTTVVLTFTFANAGSVNVRVPVGLSSAPNTSVIPAPTSSEGAG
jgi:periplasmic copper chaperone A